MFEEGKKNGQGKGGKYLEKENIFFAEEKKNREGKGGKYFEEKNNFLVEEKEKREGKYLERKNVAIAGNQRTDER